jgi:hypothetical protein
MTCGVPAKRLLQLFADVLQALRTNAACFLFRGFRVFRGSFSLG